MSTQLRSIPSWCLLISAECSVMVSNNQDKKTVYDLLCLQGSNGELYIWSVPLMSQDTKALLKSASTSLSVDHR